MPPMGERVMDEKMRRFREMDSRLDHRRAADERQSPVHLPYLWQDEVTVKVTWPEGWEIDTRPEARSVSNSAGRIEMTIETDTESRTVTTSRTFMLTERDFENTRIYADLQRIYDSSVRNDAQPLVLVQK